MNNTFCSIIDLIERQVERTPQKVALVCGDNKLTYFGLKAKVDQLANNLSNMGAKPGITVAILMDRSIDLVIGMLAILKTGGTYLPLDPINPSMRLNFILRDSKATFLLTKQGVFREDFNDIETLDINDISVAGSSYQDRLPQLLDKDEIAYLIYTSGSTGRPKGVEISHYALTNFLRSMRAEPGISADDKLLAITSYSFDISILELFLPLISGATAVIAPWETVVDIQQIKQLLIDEDITIMQATPAIWKLLLASNWKGSQALTALCGGEAMTLDLANELMPLTKALWNMYGPTEATIWCLIHKVSNSDLADKKSIPIGYPIENTQALILDDQLKEVPIGEVGYLFVAGDCLSRGYRGRPELTRQAFVQDPLKRFNGSEILYNTRDLARTRPDGLIEYLGREDFQVKLRGHRIELREIEHLLLQHERVHEAVVLLEENESLGQFLSAYIVYQSDDPTIRGSEFKEDWHAYLAKFLPIYMVPSFFIALDKLPLSPNGKIDRAALKVEDFLNQLAGSEYHPPQTSIEKELVEIWGDILTIEKIGRFDDFLAIGGHSIAAVNMITHLNHQYGIDISLKEFFVSGRSISTLAELVQQNILNKASQDEIEELLNYINTLSDEEIQSLNLKLSNTGQ